MATVDVKAAFAKWYAGPQRTLTVYRVSDADLVDEHYTRKASAVRAAKAYAKHTTGTSVDVTKITLPRLPAAALAALCLTGQGYAITQETIIEVPAAADAGGNDANE